jgi:hypothetical protein
MLGDANDMLGRLKAVLPTAWFADQSSNLDGLLSGFSNAWAGLFASLGVVRLQARVATAQADWLDRVVLDFFGQRMRRMLDESDASLRGRLALEMQRERATRAAMTTKLTQLTGRAPSILEPARATDTGGWGTAIAWGTAGAWGSLLMPQQCFVTAYRPLAGGGLVAGDADITAAVVDMLPVASIAWLRISN